ncbi:50S ribosomal protein L11 [Candidatus Woesearchaeota archaeon]|nr:50S ribosomal protein L11 [Candidatus Woesearchaeota archaeon]
MAKESVDVLVEGGKATAAPPLGPALGPLGVNIGQVVAEINTKTKDFAGMRVPVKVNVDKDTKKFEISIGTPPSSELIKKEANIKTAASNAVAEKVADLKIEQVIKIAKMKKDSLLGRDSFARVKEICGTCDSMGIMVEGKQARETISDIAAGVYDEKIRKEKTELTKEELATLEEERKRLEEELKAREKEFRTKAAEILKVMEGKTASQIQTKMREAKIPDVIIRELAPVEQKAAPAGGAPAKK